MKTKTIIIFMLLLAAVILSSQFANAQTWNLTGNINLTNTSKIGGTSATAAQNFPLRLFTYGSERIHINANTASKVGFVGIGTTAPSTLLHVNGVITATGGNSTNWNAVVSRVPPGNLNFVPRWNGSCYVPGSIWDDGSKVGIGTTNPNAKFGVAGGDIGVDEGGQNNGTTSYGIRFGAFGSAEFIGSKRTAGGNQFGLDFYTNDTNRLAISNNGKVGIGTTNPNAKFGVAGGDIGVDEGGQNNGTTAYGIRFGGFSSAEFIGSKRTAGGNQYGLDFYTNDLNRLAILNNGNVGINTTTPTGIFEVSNSAGSDKSFYVGTDGKVGIGTVTPSAFATSTARVEIADEDGLNSDLLLRTAGLGVPYLAFAKHGGTLAVPSAATPNYPIGIIDGTYHNGTAFGEGAAILFQVDGSPAGDHPGLISFLTTPAGSSLSTARMTIRSTGDIGIGTGSPAAKLDIIGKIKITDGTQGAGRILTSNAAGLASWTNPSAVFTETDPKVGTLTPTYVPHWNGTSLADGIITDDGSIVNVFGAGNIRDSLTIGNYFGGQVRLNIYNNNNTFSDPIGTALNIYGYLSAAGLAPGNYPLYSAAEINPGIPDYTVASPVNFKDLTALHLTSPVDYFGNASSKWWALINDGNVKVNGKIHINDGTQGNGFVLTSDANGLASWTNPSAAFTETDPKVGTLTTNYVPKWNATSLTDGIIYDDGTNVGIGTNTPARKLEILHGGADGILCRSTLNYSTVDIDANDGDAALRFYKAGIGEWDVRNRPTDDNFEIFELGGGGSRMLIENTTGNVYIGTGGAPTSLLSVDGTADKPGGGAWAVFSDARLKQEVKEYTDGLDQIMKIKPVKYHYNELSGYDTKPEYVGVIAQDLKQVAPYMVKEISVATGIKGEMHPDKNNSTGMSSPDIAEKKQYLQVDNSAMTYMLINAVKELGQEKETKDAKIAELQNQLNDMRQCVDAMCNTIESNNEIRMAPTTDLMESKLLQNQPNPFNQTTIIRYILPIDAGNGKIVIRDLKGALVKSLIISNAGRGQLTVNANELAQGTYTYTLEVAGQSLDTKLMVVTK